VQTEWTRISTSTCPLVIEAAPALPAKSPPLPWDKLLRRSGRASTSNVWRCGAMKTVQTSTYTCAIDVERVGFPLGGRSPTPVLRGQFYASLVAQD